MIVRLKGAWGYCVGKRRVFQFYDSPIKSPEKNLSSIVNSSFNSMIVRLKGSPRVWNLRSRTEFQFYDSPIKRLNLFVDKYQFENSFNSMIVRLKGG